MKHYLLAICAAAVLCGASSAFATTLNVSASTTLMLTVDKYAAVTFGAGSYTATATANGNTAAVGVSVTLKNNTPVTVAVTTQFDGTGGTVTLPSGVTVGTDGGAVFSGTIAPSLPAGTTRTVTATFTGTTDKNANSYSGLLIVTIAG